MNYNKFRIWVGRVFGLVILFFVGKHFNFYGLLVVALGFLVRLWASGYIHKNQEVTKAGPYKLLRHPLYLGNFLVGLGFTLFINVWLLSLIYIPVFFLIYYRKMQLEERFLTDTFGSEYQTYRETTPLFIPKLTNLRLKDNVPFSWPRVWRNREMINLTSCVVIILFMIAYQNMAPVLLPHLSKLNP